jgi:hypothetical protein
MHSDKAGNTAPTEHSLKATSRMGMLSLWYFISAKVLAVYQTLRKTIYWFTKDITLWKFFNSKAEIPTNIINTLTYCRGLRSQMIPRAILAVEHPMPDMRKTITHTKRDKLVLQFGGWTWG